MKYLIILSALISVLISACTKEDTPTSPPIDNRIEFEITFLDYSDNNYFIDEVYTDTSSGLNIFELFYGGNVPTILMKYLVKDIEVYKSINNIGERSIIGRAYIDLPPRYEGEKYSDSLRQNSTITPGQNERARFRLLNAGFDYLFHQETGYISFNSPLNDNDIIAVAYKIENDSFGPSDDLIYGEFFTDLINNSDTIAVLKLVKPRLVQPNFSKAWKLKMKNRYKIESYLGRISDLDLDIYLRKADGSEVNTINNVRLLELFGLDKFSESGAPEPDGKFDYRSDITYDPFTSEIIFPVLQPFGLNIPAPLINYKYQAIYDTMKTYLTLPGNSFIIKGKYKPI